MNIAEMLRTRALDTPEAVGVTYLDTHMKWAEVYAQAVHLSEKLSAAGVGKGDAVGIYIAHSPGQVVAIFATALCDAVFTIINPQLSHDQVKHQVQDASLEAVIGSADFLSPLEEFFHNRQMHVEAIDASGIVSEDAAAKVDASRPRATNIPKDVSNYIYTSGSTGLAKGVVVPHRTLLDGARIVSGYLEIGKEDSILSLLPFSFDYGLNQLMSCVYTGARIVLHRYFLPSDLLKVLVQEKVTGFAAVPSIWPKVLRPNLLKDQAFPDLRYLTTAGGFHSPELLQRLKESFPSTKVIVMYGLTESFRSTYLPFEEIERRPGSIGRPVPEVEIMVVNEDEELCKPHEKGELVHRGAFVTYGYLNNPELNEEKFIMLNTGGHGCLPEPAVRSGDEVSLDEDGFIYFHGRLDMQIKSSGYRISPDEVTQAVLSTPGIAQAAVFGLPDPELGEAIHVAYETQSGHPVEENEIKRHAKDSLGAYALPHGYHYYERIPLNPNGKIDFAALKREAARASGAIDSNE